MKNRHHNFIVIQDKHDGPMAFPRTRKQRRAAFTILLLVALLAAANWVMPPGAPGSQKSSAAHASETPRTGEEFVYFPAQYVNQATEATEHIQAF